MTVLMLLILLYSYCTHTVLVLYSCYSRYLQSAQQYAYLRIGILLSGPKDLVSARRLVVR
jgi:hypothetical protein